MTKEELYEKYKIQNIDRFCNGRSYIKGYAIQFGTEIPTDLEELERICLIITGDMFFETNISIDKENNTVRYWGPVS